MSDKYKLVGHVYDFLSNVYSLGAISKCKKAVNEHLKPGDKVLFVGAGHGEDAISACLEKGADVTVVELSQTMAEKLAAKYLRKKEIHEIIFKANEGKLNILVTDIMDVDHNKRYDYVVANFFLNVFDEEFVDKVLEKLTTLVAENGTIVIGDFARPNGNAISKILQNIYWYVAVSFFCIFSQNAFHPIYHYRSKLDYANFHVHDERSYTIFGIGYETIFAKQETPKL